MRPAGATHQVAARKHLVLLVGVVLLQIAQPLLVHGSVVYRTLYDAAFAGVAALVSAVIFVRQRDRWVALALILPAIVTNVAHYALPAHWRVAAEGVYHCSVAAFIGFAVVVILRDIFSKRAITLDEVLGVIAGYVLGALAWGNLYALTQLVAPDSFTVAAPIAWQLQEWHLRRALFDYFSFTTLTTLGFGDITPTRSPAYTLVWLEVMFGNFYMAVVVAQLVGIKMAQAIDRDRGDPR